MRAPIPFWLMALALALLVAAVYSNTYDAEWVLDDERNIIDNPMVRNPTTLVGMFRYNPSRFLGFLSFAANYRFCGENPGPYRVVNIAIHLWAILALLWLLRMALASPALGLKITPRERDGFALFGAAVFACHPIQTQAVTYVVQRFESLAAAFLFTGVALYVAARTSGGRKGKLPSTAKVALYVGSFAAVLCGIFTKQTAAVAPGLIIAVEFLVISPSRKNLGRRVLLLIPCALLLAAVLFITFVVRGYNASDKPPITHYLMTQAWVHLLYLKLLVFPVGQNLDHDITLIKTLADPRVWAGMAVIAAAFAAAWATRKKHPLIALGILWYFITLSVTSSVISLWDYMFEHRLYPAMGGFAIVLVGLGTMKKFNAKNLRTAGVIIIIVLATLANMRNFTWRTKETIYYDSVQKAPMKARTNYNYGWALYNKGAEHYSESLIYLARCTQINNRFPEAYDLMGQIHHRTGNVVKAEKNFRKAIELDPEDAVALNNFGVFLKYTSRKDEARECFLRSIKHSENYPDPLYHLGLIEMENNRFAEAEQWLTKAYETKTGRAKALPKLIELHKKTGNTTQAEKYARELDEIKR